MTVPRTDPDVRTPASSAREESTREKNEGQLSALQVAAGALAAVSAAVIASFFGVAGTVIGAAVASVVSTVGAAVYTESMRRTHAGLRRLVRSPQAPVHRSAGDRPPLPAHLDPRRSPPHRRWARWAMVAATAVAVFGLAMVVVTTVELIGHKPVAALVGGSDQTGGTTLGALTGTRGGDGRPQQAPASPSTTPTDGIAPASDPAPTATSGDDSTPRSGAQSRASSTRTSSAPSNAPATPTAPAEPSVQERPATPAPEQSASTPSEAESKAEPGQPSSGSDSSP